MSRGERRCALCGPRWASALLCLACSSPELGGTLFSCADDGDCAPGQVCAAWQGQLACQRRPAASIGACADGNCGTPVPIATDAPLQGEGPATAGAPAEPDCGERSCVSAGAPLSTEQRRPAPPGGTLLADAGLSAGGETLDVSPGGAAATLPDAGARDAGSNVPTIRIDFESSLEGWQSVPNQRPEDALDGTERSTALAHHGRGALRMIYDGSYTPVSGVSASNSFYGAYERSAPPPGVEVGLWMLATAPAVSVEVYSQTSATSARTVLATVPLPQNQWREITAIVPAGARQFGVRVLAEPDLRGYVYLDEIRW